MTVRIAIVGAAGRMVEYSGNDISHYYLGYRKYSARLMLYFLGSIVVVMVLM